MLGVCVKANVTVVAESKGIVTSWPYWHQSVYHENVIESIIEPLNAQIRGSLERLTHSVTFYHIAYEWTQNETYSCPGWIDYHEDGTISCNSCGYDYTAERGRTGG